jgi:hypothetical protein
LLELPELPKLPKFETNRGSGEKELHPNLGSGIGFELSPEAESH